MLRSAKVTQEVVVLELAGEQEQRVEGYAEERSVVARPASH